LPHRCCAEKLGLSSGATSSRDDDGGAFWTWELHKQLHNYRKLDFLQLEPNRKVDQAERARTLQSAVSTNLQGLKASVRTWNRSFDTLQGT